MAFRLLPDEYVDDFRRQRRAGITQPKIPEGAFDQVTPRLRKALDEELPTSVRKQLDVLSPGAKDQLRRFLSKDQSPPLPYSGTPMSDQEPEEESGDLNSKICALLEQAGVDPAIIARVRELAGDGTLSLQHEEDGPFTTQKAFDEQYGAGSSAGSSAYPARPSTSPNMTQDQRANIDPFLRAPFAAFHKFPWCGPYLGIGWIVQMRAP
jgi:hypothetical protein